MRGRVGCGRGWQAMCPRGKWRDNKKARKVHHSTKFSNHVDGFGLSVPNYVEGPFGGSPIFSVSAFQISRTHTQFVMNSLGDLSSCFFVCALYDLDERRCHRYVPSCVFGSATARQGWCRVSSKVLSIKTDAKMPT